MDPDGGASTDRPVEWHKVICWLMERDMLTQADQRQLLMVSKDFYRAIFRERERLHAKWCPLMVSPRKRDAQDARPDAPMMVPNPDSLVALAVKADDSVTLDHLLGLAELDKDSTCLNGRLLRAPGCVYFRQLTELCFDDGAIKCFGVAMRWVEGLTIPISYDLEALYSHAIVRAHDGRVDFLLSLDDRTPAKRAKHASPDGLYGFLLSQARSPGVFRKLAMKMPPGTDFVPFLLEHCSDRFTHPGLLQYLVKVVGLSKVNEPYQDADGWSTTAFANACRALHLNAMQMFLSMGIKPFEHYRAHGLLSASYNPLFAAVVQELPSKPEARPGLSDPAEIHKMLVHDWRQRVEAHSSRLLSAVGMLVNAARAEFEGRPEDQLIEMLDIAAVAYLHTLRTFLLANLPWLLPKRVKQRMLVARTTTTTTTTTAWERDNPIRAAGYGPPPGVTWRRGLPGAKLRDVLSEHGCGLNRQLLHAWDMLASRNIVDEAERWLVRSRASTARAPRGPWNSMDCLFELIVAANWELPVDESPWSLRRGSDAEAGDEGDVAPPAGVGADVDGDDPGASNAEGGGGDTASIITTSRSTSSSAQMTPATDPESEASPDEKNTSMSNDYAISDVGSGL